MWIETFRSIKTFGARESVRELTFDSSIVNICFQKMDFFVIVVLLLLVAFVAFLLLADSDLSLFVVQKFGKKLGEFQYRRWLQ